MMSVGYFKLANHSNDSIVLDEVFCKDLGVSLHTSFFNSEGMMAMKSVESIEIESGSSIIFQPGSHHLMIVGLDTFMKDDKLECSLVLDKTQNLPIVFKLH
jgi:periplasmic copper chaperone A